MDGDFIETPLGKAPLDKEASEFLVAEKPPDFHGLRPPSGSEHSAENEIPFVQGSVTGKAKWWWG